MPNKPLVVSDSVRDKVNKASDEFGYNMKEYTEAALLFFLSRGLNPKEYTPSEQVELAQMMRKGFDRVIAFIKTQEQTILTRIVEELIVNRKLAESQINLFIELLADEGLRPALHRAVEGYLKNEESATEERQLNSSNDAH